VLEGTQLAGEVQRIDDAARQLRDGYDSQIVQAVSDVNRLAEEIQKLNIRITQTEGGSASKSQAGALRTQRNNALNELSELIDVNAIEQPSGGLSIAIGGEFLVFEGQRREITVLQGSESGLSVARLEFSDTGKELELTKGRVHGLATSRDEIVGGFRDRLDSFAKTLIYEFNKTYSQGQGTEGFRSLTSQDAVRDRLAPLDAAGLAFAPENGQFQLIVRNARTGNVKTSDIEVKLVGLDGDTSLDSLAKAIDAVEGIGAAVDANGRLQITSDSTEVQFSFANDTSGALAALGVNTFFTGSGAATIGVNDELQGIQNASKFAAATTDPRTGQRNETGNLVRLTALIDEPLEALGGASIANQYEQTISELAQNSTIAGSVADGLSVYADTLSSEFEATSGVNIDEEAIEMISLQRIYQATARYISTIQEMLDTLVRL
jgi:flagellar hook-associated protein 1 FlgK